MLKASLILIDNMTIDNRVDILHMVDLRSRTLCIRIDRNDLRTRQSSTSNTLLCIRQNPISLIDIIDAETNRLRSCHRSLRDIKLREINTILHRINDLFNLLTKRLIHLSLLFFILFIGILITKLRAKLATSIRQKIEVKRVITILFTISSINHRCIFNTTITSDISSQRETFLTNNSSIICSGSKARNLFMMILYVFDNRLFLINRSNDRINNSFGSRHIFIIGSVDRIHSSLNMLLFTRMSNLDIRILSRSIILYCKVQIIVRSILHITIGSSDIRRITIIKFTNISHRISLSFSCLLFQKLFILLLGNSISTLSNTFAFTFNSSFQLSHHSLLNLILFRSTLRKTINIHRLHIIQVYLTCIHRLNRRIMLLSRRDTIQIIRRRCTLLIRSTTIRLRRHEMRVTLSKCRLTRVLQFFKCHEYYPPYNSLRRVYCVLTTSVLFLVS